MSKVGLKIVTLYNSNRLDIPKTLRQIADSIECGDEGEIAEVGLVLQRKDGSTEVFALGQSDSDRVLVLLEKGKFKVLCAGAE